MKSHIWFKGVDLNKSWVGYLLELEDGELIIKKLYIESYFKSFRDGDVNLLW